MKPQQRNRQASDNPEYVGEIFCMECEEGDDWADTDTSWLWEDSVFRVGNQYFSFYVNCGNPDDERSPIENHDALCEFLLNPDSNHRTYVFHPHELYEELLPQLTLYTLTR